MKTRRLQSIGLISLALIVVVGIVLSTWIERYLLVEDFAPAEESHTSAPRIESEAAEPFHIHYREPGHPVRLKIPSLSIDAYVTPVGLDKWRGVEVPENINVVGWYELGVSPHQGYGSTALVGHRDGSGGAAGVFLQLGELKIGHRIKVINRDGSEVIYRVSEVELVSKEQFPVEATRYFAQSGPEQLTLISCGGKYDRSRGGYQSNVVVTSTPVR